MKTKIATALSIVGVLGAGSAAALVNTQILDGSHSEAAVSAAVLPPAETVDLTVPSTTIDDSDEEESTSTTIAVEDPPAAAPAAMPAAAPAALAEDFLTAFNVGDSGVVTVDVVDGRLLLVNTSASAGWTVTKAEEDGPDHVEVTFTSSTVRVEFEATFDGVTITPSVSSEMIQAPAAAPAVAPASGGSAASGDDERDDDDEYEDHESDDHEREDHESDDHSGHEDDSREDD